MPTEGKQVAPVTVSAEIAEGSAAVTVSFEAPATGVRVEAWGVDGLAVDGGGHLESGASFGRGEKRTFQIRFIPGAGRSNLVVGVTGMFGGSKRDRTVSFALGKPSPAQLEGPGSTIVIDDGQRLQLMPAKRE